MEDSKIIKRALSNLGNKYNTLEFAHYSKHSNTEYTLEELQKEIDNETIVGKEFCENIIETVLTLFIDIKEESK